MSFLRRLKRDDGTTPEDPKKEIVSIEIVKDEFDALGKKFLLSCKSKIKNAEKEIENTHLQKYSLGLAKLGFQKSEPVKKLHIQNDYKTNIRRNKDIISIITEWGNNYNLHFIPCESLDSLCMKYNINYAPVKYYIGNIPKIYAEKIVNFDFIYIKKENRRYLRKEFYSGDPILDKYYANDTYTFKESLFALAPLTKFSYRIRRKCGGELIVKDTMVLIPVTCGAFLEDGWLLLTYWLEN